MSLTFDLKAEADTVSLVSVLHTHGVDAAVLLLCTDQGEDTQVSTENIKSIPQSAVTAQSRRFTNA